MASFSEYPGTTGRTRSSDATLTDREDTISGSGTNSSTSTSATESMEDDEAVILNTPLASGGDASGNNDDSAATASKSPIQTSTTTAANSSDDEPRRCWICYTDETEDSPLNSEWRSPCPCALTAHEACLLDWLADLENPRARRRNGRRAKMVCPQCKSKIVVSRPRSYIVDAVRIVERLAGRLVLPGMVFTLAGTVWAGCCAHGVYSMYFVFGTEEARRILEETMDGTWNSGLNLGLPLIPLVLIFSRTRYAESLLPAIPVLFFATHNPGQEIDLDLWPPSAAMTFAALPYVKSVYGAIYQKLFGKLERKWIAEVQPRQADINEFDDNAPPEHPEGGNDGGDGEILMEIDLEFQVGMGNDDEPQDALGLHAGENALDNGQNQGAGQDGNGLGLGRREDLINETSNLADIVLGALAFPAISASMGGLLKFILPKSWTSGPSALERGRPSLLQTRWGRSVIGGCVFVLLKDALVLYCRWKLAQTHRKRKVLNYDRKRKQVVSP